MKGTTNAAPPKSTPMPMKGMKGCPCPDVKETGPSVKMGSGK